MSELSDKTTLYYYNVVDTLKEIQRYYDRTEGADRPLNMRSAEGMKAVDVQVEKLHAKRVKAGDDSPIVYPQVALVALNPHTGQVLALVGGRNYGEADCKENCLRMIPLWALTSTSSLYAQLGLGIWVRKPDASARAGMTIIEVACCNGGRRITYHIPPDDMVLTVESQLDAREAPVMLGG